MQRFTPFEFSHVMNVLQTQRPQFLLYQDVVFLRKLEIFFYLIQKDMFNLFYLHRLYNYDQSTFYHSLDVGFLSLAFSHFFHTENEEEFHEGSTLHDTGKLFIPESILKKESALTDKERWMMQHHTVLGASFLSKSKSNYISRLALHHHEHPSGIGYPSCLIGSEMKFDYFLLRLMDEFSALTLHRCYRKGMDISRAIGIVLSNIQEDLFPEDLEKLKNLLFLLLTDNPSKKKMLSELLSSQGDKMKFSFDVKWMKETNHFDEKVTEIKQKALLFETS